MRFISFLLGFLVVAASSGISGCDATTRHVHGATFFGRCASFSIQAGTAVSFDGVQTNVTTGNVGVAPGTSITGTPSLGKNYTKEVATSAAQNCAADEGTAYGHLKGLKCKNTLANSDLSGVTLSPGVYCTGSGFLTLKTTNLYLDGRGKANAQFIFQTATTLITSTNTNIILLNGASAKNVFWQVGSSVTLGASSSFVGQIMAYASITVGDTVTVVGRLYAQAAVSFAGADTVTLPLH